MKEFMKIEIIRLEKIHYILNLSNFFVFRGHSVIFVDQFARINFVSWKWQGKDCRNCVCEEPDVRITTLAIIYFNIIRHIMIDNIMFKILLNGGLWARVELRISFQNRDIFHFRSWLWVFRVWNVSTYFAGYFLNENVAQSNYITYITTFLNP